MTRRRLKRIRIARNKAIRAVAQAGFPVDVDGKIVRIQARKPRALRWRLAFLRMERAGGLGL
jgi:hypothetical protein